MAITDEQILASPRYYSEEIERLVGRIRELEAERERQDKVWRRAVKERDAAGEELERQFEKIESLTAQLAEARKEVEQSESRIVAERRTSHNYTTRLLEEHEQERRKWIGQFELLDDPDGLYSEAKSRVVAAFRSQVVSRIREVAAKHKTDFCLRSDCVFCSESKMADDLADEIQAMDQKV